MLLYISKYICSLDLTVMPTSVFELALHGKAAATAAITAKPGHITNLSTWIHVK